MQTMSNWTNFYCTLAFRLCGVRFCRKFISLLFIMSGLVSCIIIICENGKWFFFLFHSFALKPKKPPKVFGFRSAWKMNKNRKQNHSMWFYLVRINNRTVALDQNQFDKCKVQRNTIPFQTLIRSHNKCFALCVRDANTK